MKREEEYIPTAGKTTVEMQFKAQSLVSATKREKRTEEKLTTIPSPKLQTRIWRKI